MLTDDLTDAMTRATAEQPAHVDIDFVEVVSRARRVRRRRRVGAVSSVVGVVVVSVTAILTVQLGWLAGLSQHDTAAQQAASAFSHWGPTRGSLADNPTFLAQIRQEWIHPTGPDYVRGPRDSTGPINILFAGQTPDGPAAVVAQRSKDKQARIYVGVMTTIPGHGLSLWGPNSPEDTESTDANVGRFSASQVSFTSGSGHHLIILPTDPSDSVVVSTAHQLNADGKAVRTWTSAPSVGGVAVVAVPSPKSSWDTLIRVFNGQRLDGESRVWINATRFPLPANELRSQSQINAVVGQGAGGTSAGTYAAWTRLHGPADEPFGVSGWEIDGILPDGSALMVQQMWLIGDPAHTVVLREDNNAWQVLYDAVTKRHARPLLAARLPVAGGWLIAAGPHASITGYREVGSKHWIVPNAAIRDYSGANGDTPQHTRAAAYIKTLTPKLQIRMVVDGQQRTATVGT